MTDRPRLTDITLRPLRPEEYDAFRSRCRADYAADIARNFAMSNEAAMEKADADLAKYLVDGLETEDHHIYKIERAGAPVGELWIGLQRSADGVEAFGYDFHIEPELRDGGIGRRAMELAAETARQLGANRLGLSVFGENERATHLYRSFGFQVASINMVLPLTSEERRVPDQVAAK